MNSSPTILVLDDAADTRRLVETCLRNNGYRVISAVDGITGLELAERYRPDLVLTDILMPGMSGFRVVDRLRSDATFQPRIIMMSGFDAPLHQAYAQALGADAFLSKPFSLRQLLDNVRALCPLTSACPASADELVRA